MEKSSETIPRVISCRCRERSPKHLIDLREIDEFDKFKNLHPTGFETFPPLSSLTKEKIFGTDIFKVHTNSFLSNDQLKIWKEDMEELVNKVRTDFINALTIDEMEEHFNLVKYYQLCLNKR